nr:DUF262 domain-containing protein [uncultured Methanoregula sp.]
MSTSDNSKIEEYGEEDTKELKIDRQDISEAVTWGTDWTVETIFNQLEKGNIWLNPKFQRRNAWNEVKKSKLIESLILGLPVPEIIFAESKEKKGTYIVIDGKQRLLSIRCFLAKPDDLIFKPFKLVGLEILTELNGKNYQDIGNYPHFSQYKSELDNQAVRTVIIKNWGKDSFLFSIFYRLNTGSEPLAPQELRQALHPGRFVEYIDDFAIKSAGIKKMLKNTQPDSRMRDTEMAIRYLAFKNLFKEYDGKLKDFLDDCCELLNARWMDEEDNIKSQTNELEEAIKFTFEIFGPQAFSKYQKSRFINKFNRAVFDIMVFYFSDPEVRKKALPKKKKICEKFIELCKSDSEFFDSFGAGTKTLDKTVKRFSCWGNNLSIIIQLPLKIPSEVNGRINISYTN